MNFTYKCNAHFVPLKDKKGQIVLFKMNTKEQVVVLSEIEENPLQLHDSI